jgi:hypothetical protein
MGLNRTGIYITIVIMMNISQPTLIKTLSIVNVLVHFLGGEL